MPPKTGTKHATRLKPDQVSLVCDKCGALIADDGGYLCVIDGHAGVKRWRAFHDACQDAPCLAGHAAKPIVVRCERVSTYSKLLTTLADLGTDPRFDFANTAWPALLKRIAFDTDWGQSDGRKTVGQLARENTKTYRQAGLNKYLKSPEEVARELIAKKNARNDDRREAGQP